MSLLRDMGKGYLALCSYNCKEAINILSHLPSHHYNTGWVLCQIGRAYFELAEYMQVGAGAGPCSSHLALAVLHKTCRSVGTLQLW